MHYVCAFSVSFQCSEKSPSEYKVKGLPLAAKTVLLKPFYSRGINCDCQNQSRGPIFAPDQIERDRSNQSTFWLPPGHQLLLAGNCHVQLTECSESWHSHVPSFVSSMQARKSYGKLYDLIASIILLNCFSLIFTVA